MAAVGHGPRLSRVALAGAGIVVVGVIVGWTLFAVRTGGGGGPGPTATGSCSLPAGTVTYEALQCHPEAHLFYPGATVYERLGASQTDSPSSGVNPAFSGAILISADPVSKIYAWYDERLKPNGWYRAPVLGGGYASSHEYARTPARESFGIDIDNPTQLSATLGHLVPPGGTIFEVRYFIFPYRPGQHTPAPSCPPTPEATGLLSSFYCNP